MAGGKKHFTIIISAIDKASKPLNKTRRQIAGIGKSMARTGRTMAIGLTAPILAFGGFTIKTAANFESSMNRVRGITKANKEEFELLNEQAKLLGSTTQFTASQSADAMEAMAKTGFSVEEIYAALPGVLQLAAASNVDLGEAAKLSAGLLKGFNMEASEMETINDALVTANLSTNTTLVSIAETLKEIAPLATSFGMDLGEVAAAAGFMGDALLEGGRGGVALRTIMLAITNATPAAQRVLDRLKIPRENLVDTEGNLKSLIAVADELQRAGATVEDLGTIFGKRGVTPMTALVNRGSEALQGLKDKINGPDSVGEAARQAKIRMEGSTGAMLEFKSAVEGLQIAIGDAGLLGEFESITDALTKFTQGLSRSSPAALWATTIIAGLVAVVAPLMIIIGLAATAIAGFTAPIWIAIAAVMGLIAVGGLLIVYWDEIGDALGGTLYETSLMFERWFDAIVSGFNAIVDVIPDFLVDAFAFGGRVLVAGAAGGGGFSPVTPPAKAEVAGQIGVKIESDVPARVTSLETSGDVEIDVDSGPGMAGL